MLLARRMDTLKSVLITAAVGCNLFLAAHSTFSQTWMCATNPGGQWRCAASSADGSKLVAAIGDAAPQYTLYTSTNSGTFWMASTNAPYVHWGTVASSADGNKLAAIGNGRFYSSTNAGATWDSGTNLFASSIASSADGNKLVAAGSGHINTSTNAGVTWDLSTNLFASFVASSADGNKLVTAGGAIYTSTDSGTTWISNNAPPASWTSVASSANGNKLVAIDNGGWVYTSTDSGTTWISNNVPSYGWYAVASSADGNQLVTAGFGSGIYTSQTTPTPLLNFTRSSDSTLISWIVPSQNFTLQENSDLTTTNWLDVTNVPVLNLTNLQNEVVLPLSFISNRFYRLKQSP